MHVPKSMWPVILAPFNGEFPQDDAQFRVLLENIRKQGNYMEHTHAGPLTMEEGVRMPAATGTFFNEYNFDDGMGFPGAQSNF